MANNKDQPRTLDDMLKESREKRKAEALAQEIFGRRSKTPATAKSKPALGASLASRVGVSKQRTASLPRSNSARNARAAPPPHLSRPPAREDHRHRQSYPPQPQLISSDPVIEVKSNGYSSYEEPAANGGDNEISIRGVAAGPHIVIASNFAPGTTAADIESVMLDVGGQMTECRLVSENPVMAEMTFVEKSGGETVINTFNNKKADGRTLHVYWKQVGAKVAESQPIEVPEEAMEVDENAQSREVENRLREERRGRPDRDPRGGYPTGPKEDYGGDYYNRGPRRPEPAYQDSRWGFGGGHGPRRYRDDGRLGYPRGGGQSWRP